MGVHQTGGGSTHELCTPSRPANTRRRVASSASAGTRLSFDPHDVLAPRQLRLAGAFSCQPSGFRVAEIPLHLLVCAALRTRSPGLSRSCRQEPWRLCGLQSRHRARVDLGRLRLWCMSISFGGGLSPRARDRCDLFLGHGPTLSPPMRPSCKVAATLSGQRASRAPKR